MTALAITAAAAITSVGDDVDQTCSSIRAGIKVYKQHPWLVTEGWDPEWDARTPLVAAPVRTVDPMREGPSRLVDLLLPVLSDLARRGGLQRRDLAECALLVALPGKDAATAEWDLDGGFMAQLSARSGLEFKQTITNSAGRTGMLELLATADELLSQRAVTRAIVAGVDSYLTRDRMNHLDAAHRVKSPRNVDGFVPGEGASALLLGAASRSAARGPAPLATITAVGRGDEPQPFASERQSTARGLCDALRTALSAPAPWVLCDMNGESYGAFEWGVALARLGEQLGPVTRLLHPAICHGDIGAATGGVLAACAIAAWSRGYAPSAEAVIWAASDGPSRAAARIVRPASA